MLLLITSLSVKSQIFYKANSVKYKTSTEINQDKPWITKTCLVYIRAEKNVLYFDDVKKSTYVCYGEYQEIDINKNRKVLITKAIDEEGRHCYIEFALINNGESTELTITYNNFIITYNLILL